MNNRILAIKPRPLPATLPVVCTSYLSSKNSIDETAEDRILSANVFSDISNIRNNPDDIPNNIISFLDKEKTEDASVNTTKGMIIIEDVCIEIASNTHITVRNNFFSKEASTARRKKQMANDCRNILMYIINILELNRKKNTASHNHF